MGRFAEDHARERRASPTVTEWVSGILGLTNVEVADRDLQRDHDIDFTGETADGAVLTVENKIRFEVYDDVLLETVSNMNTQSPGWIYASRADCLAYVFVPDGQVLKGYIFDLPRLQEWWRSTGSRTKYPVHYGETPRLYRTQNVAVPEKHIPLDCVIYHPDYGLINPPLVDEIDPRILR